MPRLVCALGKCSRFQKVLSTDQPLVCPLIVDRHGELDSLQRALEQARGGQGQTLLLAAEAGVGKTRLVAEVQARAEGLGFLCLQGHCFEPDVALPYGPLIDLLQMRMSGMPVERLEESFSIAPGLSTLLPDRAILVPGLTPPIPLEPEQEKQRLFRSLAQFILAPSSARPILMVVEDVHWSDATSLEFLLYLARRATVHPLLLMLSYRSDEVSTGLRHFLAELDRGRLARELFLEPLTQTGVSAMLEAILGQNRPLRPQFLETLYALTEGNPFFIEEVLKTLVVDGTVSSTNSGWDRKPLNDLRVPRSVEDAVLRRLAQISPTAQRVLSLAAVTGRRFDIALLHEITEQTEEELVQHIKELMSAQLVVEESAEQFAFRHALTRQAIYTQFLLRERQALHRTIAETIERLHTGSVETHLTDLVYHYYYAGVWEKVLVFARRLGERALTLYAPRAAIEQFSRVLEAAQQLHQPPLPAVYRGRGQAYEMQGEFERAQDDYTRSLDAAHATDDSGAEWQDLLDLGFLWLGRDYERAGDFFHQALEIAERLDDPKCVAHSLNRLGNWHANMDQPDQAQDLHRRALAFFKQLEDRQGIAETLDLLAVATHIGGDRRGAITLFEEAAALCRVLDNRQGLASILATVGHLRCSSLVYVTLPGATRAAGQAVGECAEALAIAREIGWRAGEAYVLCEIAACQLAEGEYGHALATAQEGLAIAEEIEHREWLTIAHSTLGMTYLDLLAPHAARRHCERAYAYACEAGARHLIGLAAAFLAWAHLLGQEPARAEAVLQDLVTPDAPVETLTQSVLLITYGELCLVRGDAVRALRIADRLIAWAEQVGGQGVVPRLWKLRGEALAARGERDHAETVLVTAREAAREQGACSLLWQLNVSLGVLLQRQRRRADAEQAYSAAQMLIQELMASLPDDTMREEFQRHALAQIPGAFRLTPRRQEKQAYGGLTGREREVVTLIARGLSNRQIAEVLVVSERTVEAHTGHIRGKLGLTSRAQVAAWAVAQGLV